jgi:predicted HNH restriction endonuclease
MRLYGALSRVPDAAEYAATITALAPTVRDPLRAVLVAQYGAVIRTASASELAAAARVTGGYGAVNLLYGKFGRRLCEAMGLDPEKRDDGSPEWWAAISTGRADAARGFLWSMRPEFATALERIGWASAALPPIPLASIDEFAEGREFLRLHRARERNRRLVARKKQSVLSECGRLACEVCGFDFAAAYGPRGDGFAECHHTQPISQSAPGRHTRLSELAVVCANCHRMLHRRPWVSVAGLQAVVRSREGG